MSHAIDMGADFATAMQELSAQAAGAPLSDEATLGAKKPEPGLRELLSVLETLSQRVGGLENAVTKKFEALESARGSASADFAHEFRQLEEQLGAIRKSETFNQKLFDSLHQELISYRDNFVRDSLQKPFIRDLLVLFDDLSAIAAQLEQAAAGEGNRSGRARARDNLSNTLHFLVEILHRLEVNEIEPKETVDLNLHRVISYEPAEFPEDDGRIVMRVKRGFTWRDRVLRPEEVIAKRFQ
jgi:molecular chaperone GrpE (heat shock protein)